MLAKVSKANGKLHAAGTTDGAHKINGKPLNGRHSSDDFEMPLVSQEVLRLASAAREGRFEDRGKGEQFDGEDRKVIEGINLILDATSDKLNW